MDRSNKDRKQKKSKGDSPISPEQAEKIAALRRGEPVYITVMGQRYLCHKDPNHRDIPSCQDLVMVPWRSRHYLAMTSPYQSKSNDHLNLTDHTAVPSHQYDKVVHIASAWPVSEIQTPENPE